MARQTRSGRRRKAATSAAAPGPATNYIYRDENGEPLFRVVRGRNKRFYQERWENGEWKKGIRGYVDPVLYNLPAVHEAAATGRTVWLVEGEKDAEALTAQGVVATTMPGGAGKWRDEYSHMLMGVKRVNLVWDNDDQDPKTKKYPGQEHALEVEASLKRSALNVRLLRAKAGKDAFDHFEAGHTLSDFAQERPGPPLAPAETNGHSKPTEKRKQPAVFQLALYKLREHAEQHGLPEPRQTDRGYEVCCPAHDDRSPSLGVMVGDDQPLVVKCQRGCTVQEIAEALDIDVREFSEAKLPDHTGDTERELRRLRAQREARLLLAGEAAPQVEVPDLDPHEYLNRPLPKYPYTVDELHITGSNTLVVSQYKVGKALALDTPIPTPDGWTTMGDIEVGDAVFDGDGEPTAVTFATPVQFGRKCYEVSFSDGSSIAADADHLWRTRTLRPNMTKEWTTEEIHKTLYTPDGWHLNHRIQTPKPLHTPEVELPLDPYVFGAWLGDGSSAANQIHAGDEDVEHFVTEVEDAGYRIVSKHRYRTAWRIAFNTQEGTLGRYAVGVKPTLRALGVLGDKRIPIEFLRASYEQRMALLQGIMDTDGYCGKRGLCSVGSVSEELANDYLELVCSLGMKATMRLKTPTIDGEECNPCWVVGFKPYSDQPVFRLHRKLERLQPRASKRTRSMCKTIVSVKEVESVPVRCIQVDSPTHMYLAGDAMTPTHNTTLMINLFHSLVNVEPFLGHFDVQELKGRVAYLDYEMQEAQFRSWLVAAGELDTSRMVPPWHLRGSSLHFWAKGVRERFVEWLQENEVSVLIIDTAARAWAGLVDNENDNSQVLQFTDTLDQIKAEAGVADLFLVTHMGRNLFIPEGEERSRGATRLEDWMDSGWYYTKDETGTRYLRAIGRGVDQETFALSYEPHTHSLLTSGVSKREHQNQTGLQQVVDMISQFDGPPSMTELKDMMLGNDSNAKHRLILEAETRGLLTRQKGHGRTMLCELTEAGIRLHERKIDINQNGSGS